MIIRLLAAILEHAPGSAETDAPDLIRDAEKFLKDRKGREIQ